MKNSHNGSVAYTPEISRQVFIEQIHALYKHLLVILFINLIVGCMLVYGLWNVVPQQALAIWGGGLLASIMVRIVLYGIYRRTDPQSVGQRQATYFSLGSGLTGIVWGTAGVLLFPAEALEYQLFILFVLVGMGAGAVTSLTAYMPTFYAYIIPSMAPISVQLLTVGDPIHVSLGVMTVAYVPALGFFGHNINRSFVQSLSLRFENINLVRELSEKKEQAEQANIAKSKFLAAASHDLRQPLHAISLFTAVLDESIQQPKIRKVVEQINTSVTALQNLFNALLDISRLEAGVMTVDKTDFRLQDLFDKLANDFNPQAAEKGLQIIWSPCPHTVYSDPALLEQILNNYISNAIRYTQQGYIKINCDLQNDLVNIQVKDTGIGIEAKDQQAIFTEFHQINNPERDRGKGLGLGLAIVERIAGLLDQKINVESAPGQGSTFSIQANSSQATISKHSSIKNTLVKQNDMPDTTIVVIDDDISVREGTEALLQNWGYDGVVAASTEDAIAQLKSSQKTPHGIIADYRLRGGRTGIEAIQRIHEEYASDIPALIVTGDIAAERLREVNSSGFQLLHKPVPSMKLRAFVRNAQLRQQKH